MLLTESGVEPLSPKTNPLLVSLLSSLAAVEAVVDATATGGVPTTNTPVVTGTLDDISVLVAVEAVAGAASKENLPVVTGALDDVAVLVTVEAVAGATAADAAPKENPPVVTGAIDDDVAVLFAAGAGALKENPSTDVVVDDGTEPPNEKPLAPMAEVFVAAVVAVVAPVTSVPPPNEKPLAEVVVAAVVAVVPPPPLPTARGTSQEAHVSTSLPLNARQVSHFHLFLNEVAKAALPHPNTATGGAYRAPQLVH